ncbi:MAG: hypothetical protein MJB57_02395 [Gemmatimonadetes bacterium]|nr:hypothetical protein [Gemmatimonadota bacterium]
MEELIPIVAIFFVIGVPVMSIAARFALRPLLKDLAEALGRGKVENQDHMRARIDRLETHLIEQGNRLDQLVDAALFRRELESRDGRGRIGAPQPQPDVESMPTPG